MKVPAPTLAPILRSAAHGRILARVLTDPEASFSLSDLVTWSNTSMPTVQREIERAEEAGIVVTEKVGPTRLVRANVDHPLHDAVRRVVLATYGPPAVIADVFGHLDGADAVLLFGSWAARYLGQRGPAPNDIDVLVVGASDRDAVDDRAAEAERRIGLPLQATVRDQSQRDANEESLLQEVKSRPLVPVLVDEDDVELTAELQRLSASARSGDDVPAEGTGNDERAHGAKAARGDGKLASQNHGFSKGT